MPSKKADLSKLSHLIVPGEVVHTLDGSVYHVTSKFASKDGYEFKLANLQGEAVATPEGFLPVTAALARFAGWMRFVVAYNKDFDLYVKEYIRAAGLPVDDKMNWSKFFAAVVAPKLVTRDPDTQDEAIHQIIIKALAERRILDSKNPNGFKKVIKKFPEGVRKLPLARQVTRFLEKSFAWRVSEANEYIKNNIYQSDTDSMWGLENGEEDKEINLLDTEENASGIGEHEMVEADSEIANFRKGFSQFLHSEFKSDTADQYLKLFDMIYDEVRSLGTAPRIADVYPAWKQEVGKSNSWLKVLFSQLPKLINVYIKKYLGDKYYIHPFLELMRDTDEKAEEVKKKEKVKLKKQHASLSDLKVAECDFDNMPSSTDGLPCPSCSSTNTERDTSGNRTCKNCGHTWANQSGFSDEYADVKDNDDAHIRPKQAESKQQWETPKCIICQTSNDLRDCTTCQDKYCVDCLDIHHQNNPGHTAMGFVASGGEVKQTESGMTVLPDGSGFFTGTVGKKADEATLCDECQQPMSTIRYSEYPGAKAWPEEVCTNPSCTEGQKYLGQFKHAAAPAAAPSPMPSSTSAPKSKGKGIIEEIVKSGLFAHGDAPYYSPTGCEYCGLGTFSGEVYDCSGYRNSEGARADNLYQFKLCKTCMTRLDPKNQEKTAAVICDCEDIECEKAGLHRAGGCQNPPKFKAKVYGFAENLCTDCVKFSKDRVPYDSIVELAPAQEIKNGATKTAILLGYECTSCGHKVDDAKITNEQLKRMRCSKCGKSTLKKHYTGFHNDAALKSSADALPPAQAPAPAAKAQPQQTPPLLAPQRPADPNAVVVDDEPEQEKHTVPPELPNAKYHMAEHKKTKFSEKSIIGKKKTNTETFNRTAKAEDSSMDKNSVRKALRDKIAARREARKADVAAKYARLRQVAADEPKEVDAALGELAEGLGTMADALMNLKENLDLIEAPKTAALKARIASARQYGSSFRRLADESPDMVADAISAVYHSLDDVAAGIENLAENIGVDLNLTPVEQAFADEGEAEMEGNIPEEEKVEDSKSDKPFRDFIKDKKDDSDSEEPELEHEEHDEEDHKDAAAGSDAFVSDRDEKGEPKAPEKMEIPRAQGEAAKSASREALRRRWAKQKGKKAVNSLRQLAEEANKLRGSLARVITDETVKKIRGLGEHGTLNWDAEAKESQKKWTEVEKKIADFAKTHGVSLEALQHEMYVLDVEEEEQEGRDYEERTGRPNDPRKEYPEAGVHY